jgi:hypothetical protein
MVVGYLYISNTSVGTLLEFYKLWWIEMDQIVKEYTCHAGHAMYKSNKKALS